MSVQLPSPPMFDQNGDPTPEFRSFCSSVLERSPAETAEKTDFSGVEAMLDKIDGELKTKQAIKFEEHAVTGTSSVYIIEHGFGTDKVAISIFKDISNTVRLGTIETDDLEIKLTYSSSFDAAAANLLVKIWCINDG